MKYIIVLILGFGVGILLKDTNLLKQVNSNEFQSYISKFKKVKKKEIKRLNHHFEEFKNSKNLDDYMNKVNNKKPEVSFYMKNGECYTVSEHERAFKLGTYKVTTKTSCPQ